MAPEVVSSGSYGCAADVYSCSILLHELLTGIVPFGARKINNGALVMAILRGQRPPLDALPQGVDGQLDVSMSPLLAKCWAQDPDERLGAEELMERLQVLIPGRP
jgi:serine/threonine protein kinase